MNIFPKVYLVEFGNGTFGIKRFTWLMGWVYLSHIDDKWSRRCSYHPSKHEMGEAAARRRFKELTKPEKVVETGKWSCASCG